MVRGPFLFFKSNLKDINADSNRQGVYWERATPGLQSVANGLTRWTVSARPVTWWTRPDAKLFKEFSAGITWRSEWREIRTCPWKTTRHKRGGKKTGGSWAPPEVSGFQGFSPGTLGIGRQSYIVGVVVDSCFFIIMLFFIFFFFIFFIILPGVAMGVADIIASSAKAAPVAPRNNTAIKTAKKRFMKASLKLKEWTSHPTTPDGPGPNPKPVETGISRTLFWLIRSCSAKPSLHLGKIKPGKVGVLGGEVVLDNSPL